MSIGIGSGERNYGNTSSMQNALRKYRVAPMADTGDAINLVMNPDCITCSKHRTDVPKLPQCQAVCGK
jgi:hypothetical protein